MKIKILSLLLAALFIVGCGQPGTKYQHKATQDLVALVDSAASLVKEKGEAAFADLAVSDSRWNKGESYIFVLDEKGNMIVHPDPKLQGKNQLGLLDVNGKPLIKWMVNEAISYEHKNEGWTHYQWPKPGGILPIWKSTYVKAAKTPSGKLYIVGSGAYNMKIEKQFVIDEVKDAVSLLKKNGRAAFLTLRDPASEFIYIDTYVFVNDMNGVELVNPAFPALEGRNIMNLQDSNGKYLEQEIIRVAQDKGSGWVDYLWPKPDTTVPAKKHTYVEKVVVDGEPLVVGCGVYLD
ncbi:MAG: cache domain-containing protein [Candidatus Margulisiibacteriota bacterium]